MTMRMITMTMTMGTAIIILTEMAGTIITTYTIMMARRSITNWSTPSI